MAGNPRGRGIVFTMDAVFALLMLVAVLPLIEVIYVQNVSPYLVHEQLHLQSEDVSSVLVKITTGDELNESPVLQQLLAQGKITQSDLDRPLIDTIGMFWAANTSGDLAIAQSIVFDAVGNVTPPGASWQAFFAEDEIAANSSPLNSSAYGTSASKRFISGFEKNKTLEGCTARAFLERAAGREEAKYGFFGGFTGQGNLTQKVIGVPSDANLSYIYFEANLGDNFSLYVNGNFCSNFSKTAGNYAVDNFTVENASYPNCIGNLSKGADNFFYINFTGSDSTKHYVGGGFVKVAYDTAQLSYSQPNAARYNFPGIRGLVNLYDSFYVPGNVSNITASLDFYSLQPSYFVIGNTTIFNISGNASMQNMVIENSSFAANFSNDYAFLSGKTVPIRFGTLEAFSGNATGNADVILITDIDGSMTSRIDADSGGTNTSCTNCSDPCMNLSTVPRINKAKCLDKQFVDSVLNVSGNRVGLVTFSGDMDSSYALSSNATALKNEIDAYSAKGGKSQLCFCCAINGAYNIVNASYDYGLINASSPWEYNTSYPMSAPPLDSNGSNWTNSDYNLSWATGLAPLGFGGVTTDLGSNLQVMQMQSQNASGYEMQKGAAVAGTLGNTNLSDSSYFELQEAQNATSLSAMAAFQLSSQATVPAYSLWNAASWLANANAQATGGGGNVQWMALESSPVRNEKILATLDSANDVYAQVWNGAAGTWGANTLMAATTPLNNRTQFSIAYERQSGDALVVYINGTNQQVQYRVWNGASFGAEQLLEIGTAATANTRVKLYPHNASDEMMLLVETVETSSRADLYASYWNGNSFGAATQIDSNIESVAGRAFDGAWESNGTEFVLFWSNSTGTAIKYANFSNASLSWQAGRSGFDASGGDMRFIRASNYPQTENIMACWHEYSQDDLACQMWNGTQLGTGVQLDASLESLPATTRNFDVAPALGTGGFIAMFGDSNDDWFNFYLCNSAANCLAGTYTTSANSPIALWSSTQLGGTDTSWGQIYADANNPGNLTLLGASQTAANGWYRTQIYCNSTSCYSQGNWASLGGATTSVAMEGAAFSFDAHPSYALRAEINSSLPAAEGYFSLNATVVFNSTVPAHYWLEIYNYSSSAWEKAPCQSTFASPDAFAAISCNVSPQAGAYVSGQSAKIALVQNASDSLATAKIDFVQFYPANASGNYFFKKTFSIPDASVIEGLNFSVYSDAAADVYFNGVLIDSDDDAHAASYWNRQFSTGAGYIASGNNTVAVRLKNFDNTSAKFDLQLNASQKRKKYVLMMADGIAGSACAAGSPGEPACNRTGTTSVSGCGGGSCAEGAGCDCAIQNANYSACRTRTLPAILYSIGFGPVSTCFNANNTLQIVASCGGGAYYYSSNASQLQAIYSELARLILNQTILFSTQIANVSGNATNMTIFPSSYLEFTYSSQTAPPQFRQIKISSETEAFPNCTGAFFIPPADSIDDVKITSYSQNFWTSQVDAKNDSGIWQNAFNLSVYASDFQTLGDPFVVYLNPRLFKANATNRVNVSTGANATNSSAQCSSRNKAFYSYRVTLPSVFSPVLANCAGRNVTVFFDKDGDGVADGNMNISYGTVSDPVPVSPDALEPAANAADYAFLKLMDGLNFDNQTDSVSISTGRSATQANPIDLRIPSGSVVDTTPLSGIPFMWGPAELQVTMRT